MAEYKSYYGFYSNQTFYDEDVEETKNNFNHLKDDKLLTFLALTYLKYKGLKSSSESEINRIEGLKGEIERLRGEIETKNLLLATLVAALGTILLAYFKK